MMTYPRQCITPDGKRFTEEKSKDDSQNEANKPAQEIKTPNLLKKIEISNAARPEIVVARDRAFIVYLEPSMSGNSFKVKIYDRDLTKEIASKILVTKSSTYGSPTDIRVVSDGTHLYAFY